MSKRSRYKDLPDWGEFVQVFAQARFWNSSQDLDDPDIHHNGRYFRRLNRSPVSEREPLYGRLIGATYRMEGEVVMGYPEEGGHHFIPKRRVFVARIAVAWNKIVEAVPEDIMPALPRRLPFTGAGDWPKHARKAQSELMKNVPRDAKGRWLPE